MPAPRERRPAESWALFAVLALLTVSAPADAREASISRADPQQGLVSAAFAALTPQGRGARFVSPRGRSAPLRRDECRRL